MTRRLGRRLVAGVQLDRLGTYLTALWRLGRDRRTPRAAKWVALATLAYAASPIDLIPDFIPILGQLDDMILVPLGVALTVRLTPRPLWDELLREAERSPIRLPRLRWMAAVVIGCWLALLAVVVTLWWR